MDFSRERILRLREEIKKRLSPKRYDHTLGVETAAFTLGSYLLPEKIQQLRCAALLHDVAKELPQEEQLALISTESRVLECELEFKSLYHAFAAPELIRRDYPELASQDVLSAVFYHTTADACMSLFDEIIFVADYIEPGREYPECIETRETLVASLNKSESIEDKILALHRAMYSELTNTVAHLNERGAPVNPRTAFNWVKKKLGISD